MTNLTWIIDSYHLLYDAASGAIHYIHTFKTPLKIQYTIIVLFVSDGKMGLMRLFVILYALAMAATAVAVLLGCAVTDPKMGQEFLPVLFMPQILFSGLFIPTGFIPVWLR